MRKFILHILLMLSMSDSSLLNHLLPQQIFQRLYLAVSELCRLIFQTFSTAYFSILLLYGNFRANTIRLLNSMSLHIRHYLRSSTFLFDFNYIHWFVWTECIDCCKRRDAVNSYMRLAWSVSSSKLQSFFSSISVLLLTFTFTCSTVSSSSIASFKQDEKFQFMHSSHSHKYSLL